MTHSIRPKVLKEGATIGIAAASSSFSEEKFYKGVDVLKSLGFHVRFNEDIFRKNGYLAGSDAERAKELNQLFASPDIDAIMFARGGYGVQRIMPLLDLSSFKEKPKVVIGFSDLTALTSYIVSHLNVPCFYGPVVTFLAESDNETNAALKKAITSTSPLNAVKDLVVIKEGEARGRLIGGCLSLISSSIGTRYEMIAKDSVLFIEDHGECIYRYDRMLTQLKNSGLLKGVTGIVFGSMGLQNGTSECHSQEFCHSGESRNPDNLNALDPRWSLPSAKAGGGDDKGSNLWSMVEGVLHDFPGPILSGLNSGHTSPFFTLPLGVECRLVAGKGGELSFKEAALG